MGYIPSYPLIFRHLYPFIGAPLITAYSNFYRTQLVEAQKKLIPSCAIKAIGQFMQRSARVLRMPQHGQNPGRGARICQLRSSNTRTTRAIHPQKKARLMEKYVNTHTHIFPKKKSNLPVTDRSSFRILTVWHIFRGHVIESWWKANTHHQHNKSKVKE